MRPRYPSGIRREPLEPIRVLLERARRKTARRKVDWSDVFSAVRHLNPRLLSDIPSG